MRPWHLAGSPECMRHRKSQFSEQTPAKTAAANGESLISKGKEREMHAFVNVPTL